MTATQVDRLGDRLRKGNVSEEDLRLLDDFRRSFSPAYESVVATIRDDLGLLPTGRPAKSTASVVEKLRRESMRLTQMQDIAGCRLIVTDLTMQDSVVGSLLGCLEESVVVDRRMKPSHGYRAVHVVAYVGGQAVEIQIRTELQHLWAEFSEKLSDVLDPGLKYGHGDASIRTTLLKASEFVRKLEQAELKGAIPDVQSIKSDIRALFALLLEEMKGV